MASTDEFLPNAYSEAVDRFVEFDPRCSTPQASVVVVTYRVDEDDFERVLDALDAQTATDFEVVIVDNGGHGDLEGLVRTHEPVQWYARLRENYGITFGRNLGAELARGDPLIFLDDDGIPEPEFVEAHTHLHRERDVVAARGKVLPRTGTIYNDLYSWYDLGEETFTYYINTEGNSSFDAGVFKRLAGFDEALEGRAGHEGVELTYRIAEAGYDRSEIVYYPDAVIRHDGVSDLRSYIRKRLQRKANTRRLNERYPNLTDFTASYREPNARSRRSNASPVDRARLRGAEAAVEAIGLLLCRVHRA